MAAKKTVAVVVAPQQSAPQPYDNSAEALIARAIDNKVDVGTMERLLAMRRDLKAEKAKEAYDQSLAAFQGECPVIKKTKEVKDNSGKVAYRFAPIDQIIAQVKPLLLKHGFSYNTGMELKEGGVRVVCRVTHSMGHSEESFMEVPFGTKTNIMSQSQVAAAAQSFAKRYAFCNAFGILTGDEDVDGRLLVGKQKDAGDDYEKAVRMIKSTVSIDGLKAYVKKLEQSTKFSDAQKFTLGEVTEARIEELQAK